MDQEKEQEQLAKELVRGLENKPKKVRSHKKIRGDVAADVREKRGGLVFLVLLVGVVVVVLLVGLGFNLLFPDGLNGGKLRDPDRTWFEDNTAVAELSTDGIKAAVYRAYYTKDGHLAVELDLANGREADAHPTVIYVDLFNEEGETIGAGSADAIDPNFTVPAGEHAKFIVYVAPEHLSLKNDDLDQIGYTITIDSDDV